MLKYRVLYGVVLAAAFLFYLFFEGYLSFITFIFVALMPVISLPCTFFSLRCLRLQLESNLPVSAKGTPAQFLIRIQNTSIFPIAHAVLILNCRNSLSEQDKKAVVHLPIGVRNTAEIRREIVSHYCGKLTVQLDQIQIYDFFGIFKFSKKIDLQTKIYVTPLMIQIEPGIDNLTAYNLESNTYSKEKSGDDSSEIFQIREFREGDRLRSVHWKLSSRLDKLMVKEFSLPLDKSVVLLFDLLSAPLNLIDTQIEAIASLSQFLLNNQICHVIEWYNSQTEQFEEVNVQQEDDLPALLNQVLETTTYSDNPYTLIYHNTLSKSCEYSHAIYVTTKIDKDRLMEFCSNMKHLRITILLITEGNFSAEQDLENSLHAMNITILPVKPGKLLEGMDDLIV